MTSFGITNDLGQPYPHYYSDQNLHNPLSLNYRQQDEYLEWAVHIDEGTGKIKEILFTCEGPEYWEILSHDQNLLLQIYQRYASPSVVLSDLLFSQDVYDIDGNIAFHAGQYNPYNKWNLSSAIHLTHPANYLSAEINITAVASQLFGKNGNLLSDSNDLICCAKYGDPNRNSDPTIGSIANSQARSGKWISLRDPIGLYIAGIDSSQFQKPDGSSIPDFLNHYWTIIRANNDNSMILRAKLSVPEGEMVNGRQMLLGDLLVKGRQLQYGSQAAETITMGLYAVTVPNGPRGQIKSCQYKCCNDIVHPSFENIVGIDDECPQPHPFNRAIRMNSLSRVHTRT